MLSLLPGGKRAFACFLSAGGALVLGACSALVGFDGFVGTGGTDASDEASARDGAAADASPTPTDGAATFDAADASEAGRGSFCASLLTPASFCDDFERDSGVQGGWTQVSASGPGAGLVLAVDAQGSFAHAEVGGGGMGGRHASLELDVPPSVSKLTAQWRMRVQAITDPDLYSELFSFAASGSAQGYRQVVFAVQSTSSSLFNGSANFEDGGAAPGFNLSATSTRGIWQAMSLTFDFKAGTSVLTVDATPAVKAPIPPAFTPTSLSVRFGVNYIGTNGAAIAPLGVDLDDVVITYQ